MTISPVSPIIITGVVDQGGMLVFSYTPPNAITPGSFVHVDGCLDSGGALIPGLTLTGAEAIPASPASSTQFAVTASYVSGYASGGSVWIRGGAVSAATMTGFDSKLATQVTDKTGDVVNGAYTLANATLAMSIKGGGVLQANAVGAEVVTSGNAHFELGDSGASSPSPGWTGDDVLLQPTRTRAINVSCTETFCEWYTSYLPGSIVSITAAPFGNNCLIETSAPHQLAVGDSVTVTDSLYSSINAPTYGPWVVQPEGFDATHILIPVTCTSGPYGARGTVSTTTNPALGNPTNRIGAVAVGGFFSNIGLPGVYGIAGTGPVPVQSFYLPLTRLHHGATLVSATLYFFPITSLFATGAPALPTVFPTLQIYRTNFTSAPAPLAASGPAVFATPATSGAYQTTPALGSSGAITLATLNSGAAALSAGQQLTDPAGFVFQVSTSGTYANGAPVPIAAVIPTGVGVFYGANTNDVAGTVLTWVSAPTNCKPTQPVAAPGLLGGLNAGYAQSLVFTPDADMALIDQSQYAYVAVWTGDNAVALSSNASPTVYTAMKIAMGGITCMAPQ